MHRRIILAALAAALAVPAVASATDKQAGPGDRAVPEAWQNRDQTVGGSTSQAVGGQGANNATVGRIGNAANVGQTVGGSTPAATGVGGSGLTQQAVGYVGGSTPAATGGDGTTPMESAYSCGSAKDKVAKSDPVSTKFSKGDPTVDLKSSELPHDEPQSSKPGEDTEDLEDQLREQREMVDRLTQLLNEMHQRQQDVTRSITGG